MRRRWLTLALLSPCLCLAQLTGNFSLDKTTFAPGEPVFLTLTMHNEGKEPVQVVSADPYSSCSDLDIHISNDAVPAPACFRHGFGGSCPSGVLSLAPGASYSERILLNFQNDSRGSLQPPVKVAGNYTVDASGGVAHASLDPVNREVHQALHLTVDDSLNVSPGVYEPFVRQLDSDDIRKRQEAARTLATLAPPALEPLLLTFATSKDPSLRQLAPLALGNLATKTSLSALAQLLLQSTPESYENMMAAEQLGRTHDPAWMPVLLEYADQHGSAYLAYAAESGEDAAIEPLLARMQSPDPGMRSSVIFALGHTGSRAAIPILIDLLGRVSAETSEEGKSIAIEANAALAQLTHLYIDRQADDDKSMDWYRRWHQWWQSSGKSLEIHPPTDCVADTKLP